MHHVPYDGRVTRQQNRDRKMGEAAASHDRFGERSQSEKIIGEQTDADETRSDQNTYYTFKCMVKLY
jgi:hypothetical protein